MPTCPKCGAEFESNVSVCSDCGVELIDAKQYQAIQDRENAIRERSWAVIAETSNPQEALMWRQTLAATGYEVVVSPDLGHVEVIPLDSLVQRYKISVPADQEKRARKELDAIRSTASSDSLQANEESDE